MTQDLSRFPELHALETRILTRLSDDVPLGELLEDITLTVDRLMADVRSSILLVENSSRIRHGAAPNMPAAFNAAIDGQPIGPSAGSCGTAAWLGKPVIVRDALTDPLWHDFRELALAHNIRACWSTPVLNSDNRAMATFAIYHATAREPNQAELNFIQRISHFVRVAVERAQQRELIRKSEEKLMQMQRLEALGQLTGGIAHDFNNLLTVIIGHAEWLTTAQDTQPTQQESLQMIMDAANRGAELTSRLLAFARQQALAPVTANLAHVLADMKHVLQRTLGEQILIQFRLSDQLWPVTIDTARLETAVLNLCLNARDAMVHGGCLTVEAANISFDASSELLSADVTPGDYVMLAISDTGHGMDRETLLRAFEPFFTRKPSGLGSGLGLSMVYGFIRQSRGHIRLYSEPGQGTTVRLYLPRAMDHRLAPDQTAITKPTTRPVTEGGDETILLVEDNELVRGHVEKLLRSLGYQVISAGDGHVALQILRDTPGIDLLFTDVVMPGGMNGRELAEKLRQILQPALSQPNPPAAGPAA